MSATSSTLRSPEGGVLWISGEIGQGKTRLLRRLENELQSAGRTCVYVPVPTLDAESLTIWSLSHLGLPLDGGVPALAEAATQGLDVLIDDAEHLPSDSAQLLLDLIAGSESESLRVVCAASGEPPETFAPALALVLDDDIDRTLDRCRESLGLEATGPPEPPRTLPPVDVEPASPEFQLEPAPEEPVAVEEAAPSEAPPLHRVVPIPLPAVDAPPTPDEEARPAAPPITSQPHRRALVALALLVLMVVGAFLLGRRGPEEPAIQPPSESAVAQQIEAPHRAAVVEEPPLATLPDPPVAPKEPEPEVALVAPPSRPKPVPETVAVRPPPADPAPPVPIEEIPPVEPEPIAEAASMEPEPIPEAAPVEPEPIAEAAPVEPESAIDPSPAQAPDPEPEIVTAEVRPEAAQQSEGPPDDAPSTTRVIVNAIPAALIHLNGRIVGGTPIADLDVEPGVHQFRAEFQDGTRIEREVDVRGGVVLLVFP